MAADPTVRTRVYQVVGTTLGAKVPSLMTSTDQVDLRHLVEEDATWRRLEENLRAEFGDSPSWGELKNDNSVVADIIRRIEENDSRRPAGGRDRRAMEPADER